jgi:hypothetical protein
MDPLDYTFIISVAVLGLSLLATGAKFFDWFIHSEPATMIRTTRWLLLLLLVTCVGLLAVMIARAQWSAAILAGGGGLLIASLLKWRTLVAPLLAAFRRLRPKPKLFDMEVADDVRDPETVRRAAAILEAYVRQAPRLSAPDGGQADQMSEAEALDVLGLKPGADEVEIRAAHRRLMRLVHPDHAGSTWLSRKVTQAKDTLLPGSDKLLRPFRQSGGN